jgi:hypothetical protein
MTGDSADVRHFYFPAESTILGVKALGPLETLINEQTLPGIMWKMPAATEDSWQ